MKDPRSQRETNVTERRVQTRQPVAKVATIRFNGGFCELECVVRNQSATGAKLGIPDTWPIPAVFEIVIADEALIRTVRVRWRSAVAIGVEFVTN